MSIYNAFNSGIIWINLDLIDVYSSMKTGCEMEYIKLNPSIRIQIIIEFQKRVVFLLLAEKHAQREKS